MSAANSKVAADLEPARTKWLRAKQCAELLGVSEQILATWRWKGTGPRFYKPGGRIVLYSLQDVEEWIAAHPGAAA